MNRFIKYGRNLGANWFGLFANMLVLFYLSPFVINTLGKVEYGIWSLLTVFTGYLGILDLGVKASTGRYVTLYIGKNDYKSADEVIRTSLTFFGLLSLLIFFVSVVLGFMFPLFFKSIPSDYYLLIKILLPALALNIWATTLRALVASVLVAHDRFDFINIIDFAVLMLRTIATVVVLKAGYGIIGLTGVVILCNILGFILTYFVSKKIWGFLRLLPWYFSSRRLKQLFGYGVAAFLSSVAMKVIGQTDLILVGSFISVSAVTVYSVGAMMVYYSTNFVGFIGITFFPPVQRAVAQKKYGEVKWLYRRQVRLALIFGIPLYVGFITFSEDFIRLWMLSDNFPLMSVIQASQIMIILSVSKIFYVFTLGSKEVLNASGSVKISSTISVIEAVLNLLISFILVYFFEYGLLGVALGTLVARIFVSSIAFPYYVCKKLGLSKTQFIKDIYLRGMIAIVCFMTVCILVKECLPVDNWVMFWLDVLIVLAFFVPISILILVPKDFLKIFREQINQKVLKKVKKKLQKG
ncbi:MAG: oligosaccharide flippase family protein [Desulfobacteraceae bacterium]